MIVGFVVLFSLSYFDLECNVCVFSVTSSSVTFVNNCIDAKIFAISNDFN